MNERRIWCGETLPNGADRSQRLPAVTMQDTMPLILRGEVPMANISDPARYDLLGVYAQARQKHMEAIGRMHGLPHPDKHNREVAADSQSSGT